MTLFRVYRKWGIYKHSPEEYSECGLRFSAVYLDSLGVYPQNLPKADCDIWCVSVPDAVSRIDSCMRQVKCCT